MVRVLIALTPQMYREAIALAVHRGRPGLDVRVAPPEDIEGELDSFRPHLLVHNDTAPVPAGTLAGIPCRVEVVYSDGMDAKVSTDGNFKRIDDASVEDLLGVVDRATELAGAGKAPGKAPG